MKKFLLTIALLSIAFIGNAQKIPFQGRLLENGVVVNGTKDFTFTIDVDGNSWTETHTGVTVSEGLYSVVLGSVVVLPDNLFYGTDSRSLEISITGVSLTPITIYSKPNNPNFNYVGDGSDGMPALSVNMTGSFSGSWAAFESYSATTNNTNYALYGQASGSGNYNTGVYGYALEDAKFLTGVQGIANGIGSGDTGYGVGSYNHGLWGKAQSNLWGNVGVFGQVQGSEGVDNIGVVGWSSVASADLNVLNVGTLGTAKGPGINRGVVGNAEDGIENWAGWFNGDVKITGNLSLEGVTTTAVSSDRFTVGVNEFAFWHAGDLGGNGNYGSQISFPGGVDGGNNAIPGGSSLGNKYWDVTYPESGYLHINSATGLRASLEANSNGTTEWATLNLGNTDGRYSLLNAGDLRVYNSNGNQAARLFINGNGAGNLYTYNDFGVTTGWFGNQSDKGGLWQIVGDDGSGNVTGAVLSGFWGGLPSFIMEDANAQPGIVYEIQTDGTDNWSYLNLYKSASNGTSNNNTVEIHGGDSRITLRSPDGTAELGLDAYNGVSVGSWDQGVFSNNQSINFHRGGDGGGNGKVVLGLSSFDDGGSNSWGALTLNSWDGNQGNEPIVNIDMDGSNGNIGVAGNITAASFDSGPIVIDGGASGNMWGLNELTSNSVVTGDAFDNATQIAGTNIDIFAGGSGSDDGIGAAYLGAGTDGTEYFGNMSLHSTAGQGAINMGFTGPSSSEGFYSIWLDNGGGSADEYALLNVQSGGPSGAVFGSLNLNDDLGNSVSINGYGDIDATGTITATTVTQTSDRRHKKGIETIHGALENTLKLRGVSYIWRDSGKSKRTQIGVIAQEVEEVYPEFVYTDSQGFKSVNYAQMTAVLIEAVKELNAKVEDLKMENSTLKAAVNKPTETLQIDALQKQLEQLTARFNELVGTSASSQISDK